MWSDKGLANVVQREELIGLARKRRLSTERLTVGREEIDRYIAQGWELVQERKRTAVVTRQKLLSTHLEDRVWSLLYKMDFGWMSGYGGAELAVKPGESSDITNQIDVVAIDDEVCIAIECKSMQERGRRPHFQQELAKHAVTRERLQQAVRGDEGEKRVLVLAVWTFNAILSTNDKARAEDLGILLLNEHDLNYYENLVFNLGPAARYQFLAELIPGKPVPGLKITVPALQTEMGGHRCYMFSISPEYLLKIAYVSHRVRGRRSENPPYQRMIQRSRLKRIAKYISERDALFPTNVVVSLEPSEKGKRGSGAQFDRGRQEDKTEGATWGWLTLRPAYKSAWIIDGQHRLYAYSGHAKASTSSLLVLAFESLPGSVQQKLFIDINAEQRKVKRSLYQELYKDLHKDSRDPKKRTLAFISETIQDLNDDPDSPLFDRILLAEGERTDTRCISLASLFTALDKPGFFYRTGRGSQINQWGTFWDASKRESAIVQRSLTILNSWFSKVSERVPDWWDVGAGEGGGLAMNDGVAVILGVLRSVIDHLDAGRNPLASHTTAEVVTRLSPYAEALGDHFAAMSSEQRASFRSALRGTQGQTAGVRHAQQSLHERFPDFEPDGLEEFLEREKARTNDRAVILINDIERVLSRAVVAILKEHYGLDGDRWWWDGVPKKVRDDASKLQNEDKNSRGSGSAYFMLIHYRSIITENWPLFQSLFGRGKGNLSKDRRTEWLVKVNEIRHIADHPSSQAAVSFEELAELKEYQEWLHARVSGRDLDQDTPESGG